LKTVEASVAQAFPPATEPCFLDANVLYYDVIDHGDVSTYCTALLREVAAGQRTAATTLSTLSDAVHKVMFTEAANFLNRPRAGLLAWVKKHPEVIQQLSVFRAAAERFEALPLEILQPGDNAMTRAADIAASSGLLMNDALIVVAMEARAIRHLVTNDDDFDRVPGITVWKPR
jgi:predicted nucleic acid-binding protein